MQTNHLKNGLKNSLVSAIIDYKSVLYKIERLEDKIDYYESKMCSVGGPVYGTDVRNVRNPYDNKLIYWIDKIDEARREIKDLQANISPFLAFWRSLEPLEQQILKHHLIERKSARITAEISNTNKNKVLDIKFIILKKWDKN